MSTDRDQEREPRHNRRPIRRALTTTALCGAVLLGSAALAATQAPAAESAGGHDITRQVQSQVAVALPSLAPLVERVMPAVVNVSSELREQTAMPEPDFGGAEGSPQTPFDQLLRRFFQNRGGRSQQEGQELALGSGFIVDPRGYIVTNNHVIGNADKVTVIFQDNSRHAATIVGRDPKTDLAVLKINDGDKLPFVRWGDSKAARVGDWVMAVGNPFGLGGTVTAGIISAVGRDINEGPYDDFLQIDAPINRGNSGGPTFNLSGEVIGINTAIYSPSGGSVGIGFAIPSNIASGIVAQLIAHGRVTRGWLGVAVQEVTPAIARSLGMHGNETTGALVSAVEPDSPAAKAGIRPGDLILDAGDQPITTVNVLPRIVAATPVGQRLALTVRRDGREFTRDATIVKLSNRASASAGGEAGPAIGLGMRLATLDPALRARFHVPRGVTGVVVAEVAGNGPAASIGIQPGDVIQSIDQKPVTDPHQAAAALTQDATHGTVLLLVNRRGASEFVGLTVRGNAQNPG